jgi:hypothetical protein
MKLKDALNEINSNQLITKTNFIIILKTTNSDKRYSFYLSEFDSLNQKIKDLKEATVYDIFHKPLAFNPIVISIDYKYYDLDEVYKIYHPLKVDGYD